MAEKPPSPFAGLDTSLLRSTRPAPSPATPAAEAPPADTVPVERAAPARQSGTRQPPARPTRRAATASRNHDTAVSASAADPMADDALEIVRRAVRTLGKEAATYRFTQDEKRALASIVYAYKQRGIRTSENEITRIALNYLIEEHRRNSASSILARVLALLNQ
jgi:hypothetical protein